MIDRKASDLFTVAARCMRQNRKTLSLSMMALSDAYLPSKTKYSVVHSSDPVAISSLPLPKKTFTWPLVSVTATKSTKLDYSIVVAVTLPVKSLSLVFAGAVACNA